jgi:hypothetical protein
MPTITSTGLVGILHGSKSASFRAANAHLLSPQSSPSPVAKVSPKRKDGAQCYKGNPARALIACGLPVPECEHRFHPVRRWRFDYAWVAQKVALEVEGGAWTKGRHTRGKGFVGDIEKYNAAVTMGWRVVRCVPDDLLASRTIETLKHLLK